MRRAVLLPLLLAGASALRPPPAGAADAPPAAPAAPETAPLAAEPSPVAAVVAAVATAAAQRAALPPKDRPSGDALADLYVRRAAAAAKEDGRAFLVGLAHAAEATGALARVPAARRLLEGCETAEAAARRRADLGAPSVRGRADWFAHFVVSAGLAAAAGESVASALGLGKELADLRGASGFSFADLLADDAGVAFAAWVLDPEAKGRLARVAGAFSGPAFLPDPAGLAEGLSREAFERAYGSATDPRFLAARKEVADRAKALAGTWR